MDINTYQYKGGIAFPLPSELKNNWQFPNSNSTEWQETSSVGVKYIADGSENAEWITINKVRYRYIAKDNAYEVEPIFVVNGDVFTAEYSCGIYKCVYGDSKWTQISKASPKITSKANLEGLEVNGVKYVTKFPTPSDSNFWFQKEVATQNPAGWKSLQLYDASDWTGQTSVYKQFTQTTCEYDADTQTYTVEFWDKTWVRWDSAANKNIYRWQSYGIYQCTDTGDTWTKIGQSQSYEVQE
jgi:hypothetical protein